MKKEPLDSEAFYQHLERPHNPPPDTVTDTEFEVEFYAVSDELSSILSEFGENDPFGNGDYNFDPGFVRSRGMGFESSRDDFISHDLILRLVEHLQFRRPEWEFAIYLPNGGGIFVSAERLRYWMSPDDDIPEILK